MAKIALLGCGVVGSGVREILASRAEALSRVSGEPLEIAKILRRHIPAGEPAGLVTTDWNDIASDPEISVVAECMGGLEPAYTYAVAALKSGRSFVTSNKELVAEKGDALCALAREHGVAFLFEAAVGGAVPIIKTMSGALAGNEVTRVCGILNGTTNYILTKMRRENAAFDEALAEAQRLGYAEADPTADVGGLDACRKLCILANLAFGCRFAPQDVHTEGITAITADDVSAAAAMGGAVKLIACAQRLPDGRAALRVTPAFVPGDHPLCAVEDVLCGVSAAGSFAGELTLTGAGAGKLPTGSAVVSDLIEAVAFGRSAPALRWGSADPAMLAPFAENPVAALVSYTGSDAAAKAVFGETPRVCENGRTVLLTAATTEAALAAALAALSEQAQGVRFLRIIPR